ncbi:hypothetical protein EK904_004789, partial [Melospiza melodia maxima]
MPNLLNLRLPTSKRRMLDAKEAQWCSLPDPEWSFHSEYWPGESHLPLSRALTVTFFPWERAALASAESLFDGGVISLVAKPAGSLAGPEHWHQISSCGLSVIMEFVKHCHVTASGGCSAAVSAHLVWGTWGLQVPSVCTALCDHCRSCLVIQLCDPRTDREVGSSELERAARSTVPTLCSQNQVPLFIVAATVRNHRWNKSLHGAVTCPALIFDLSSIKADKEGQPTKLCSVILGHSGQFSSTLRLGQVWLRARRKAAPG